jgi:valyl-tRNA synthetase
MSIRRKGEVVAVLGRLHPSAVEAAWQDWWEASGYYSCDPKVAEKKPQDEKFIMVIPPPNVTGSLHLGHALTAAVEDTMTRWHRMKGHATLYVPGKLHVMVHDCDARTTKPLVFFE